MIIVIANPNVTNNIGRVGENKARGIKFPIGDCLKEFPGCTFSLYNKRPTDPDSYPVPTENYTVEGDYLLWTVTSGDVAYKGSGKCEISATVDGIIVKTDIYITSIDEALDGSGTPPDPWQGWVDDVTEAAERAEAAVQEIHDLTAQAETLEPDSPATASYVDGVLTIGVPKGDKGDQGEPGERGLPGLESRLVGTLISENKYELSIERV